MDIKQLFQTKKCVFALEVFPPKRQSGVESVYATLNQLAEIPVDYTSVTYSAGGNGAKEYTAEIARYLKHTLGIEPLPHLTCMNATREEVAAQLDILREIGVHSVLALRGDPNPLAPPAKDYRYASDLVADIHAGGGFYIAGACYPEGHPESAGLAQDIEHLKQKIDAGAGHLVSQLFFDNGKFFRFLNLARKKGVNCPIEAGIMPIVKQGQLERTISLSSASLPADFTKMVSRYTHNPDAFFDAGIEYAITQIRDLIECGVDGIHLYAMNQPDVAQRVREGIADLL